MTDRLLTIAQACEQFRVSDFTLRKRIKAGELSVFVGALDRRARLVDPEEIRAYAEPRPLAVASARAEATSENESSADCRRRVRPTTEAA